MNTYNTYNLLQSISYVKVTCYKVFHTKGIYYSKMDRSDLKKWEIFKFLESEFVFGIHMVMVYGEYGNKALIVMKNRKVYALGNNECLGIYCAQSTLYPREVKALCEKNVKTFACGSKSYFLALTENGEVYSWGHSSNSKTDKSELDVTSIVPTLVNIPTTANSSTMKRVMNIVCGSHHSLVITEEGEVLSWEKNDLQQVSNISSEMISVPHQVALDQKIVQAACGSKFSLVVTEDGKVYGWGESFRGQLRNYSTSRGPTRIDSLPRIVKVACGSNYALALTDKGELYAWGGNHRGQLGIGKSTDIYNPEMVTHEMGRVSDIVALHSQDISVAVGESGCVYMWGACRGGDILIPTLAPFSTVHDVLACYASPSVMHKPLILHMDEKSSIFDCLENAFNDESTSDLTIQVENKPIYVHKAILTIRSPYFRNMFQHNWSENNQSVIEHTQFSYTVFKAFLKYLYTGVVELPPAEAFELLKVADLHCDNNLKQRCIQLIKNTISEANVISVYCTAIEHNTKELEEFCFKFALDHVTEVVQTTDFGNLSENMVKNFIDQAAKAGAFKRHSYPAQTRVCVNPLCKYRDAKAESFEGFVRSYLMGDSD